MQNHKSTTHILFCSRLVEEKGVDILLDVLSHTLKDHAFDQIVWHVASDGKYENEVRDVSNDSHGRVCYYGKISQEALAELMRSVDLLYMPSRFLETFGLTALESLACGTSIIGIKKGGLIDFIDDRYAVDEENSVESTLTILRNALKNNRIAASRDITPFSLSNWNQRIEGLFPKGASIFLLHDYSERIGGAEAYIDFLESHLPQLGYTVKRSSYDGNTTIWKRRFMFICSLIAFWRGSTLYRLLNTHQPTHIWMHSVLRYYGFWGVRAVKRYTSKQKHVKVFLSHHDVGFIAPFPHLVENESQIPKNSDLSSFLMNFTGFFRMVAIVKWYYIQAVRSVFPDNLNHIIFSKFLAKHIQSHFTGDAITIIPHTYDATIFHP